MERTAVRERSNFADRIAALLLPDLSVPSPCQGLDMEEDDLVDDDEDDAFKDDDEESIGERQALLKRKLCHTLMMSWCQLGRRHISGVINVAGASEENARIPFIMEGDGRRDRDQLNHRAGINFNLSTLERINSIPSCVVLLCAELLYATFIK